MRRSAAAKVLRVGSYHGIRGQYSSIQAAVKAAKPGDWILIGPGDYKTKPSAIRTPKGAHGLPGRGPDHQGQPAPPRHEPQLGDRRRDQARVGGLQLKRQGAELRAQGRPERWHELREQHDERPSGVNGLMVYKAANVSVQNLTVCNFLGGIAPTRATRSGGTEATTAARSVAMASTATT